MTKAMTIEEKQQEIIDEYRDIEDWLDRYAAIIDAGNELAPMDPRHKVPENLIDSCQSSVWVYAGLTPEGKVHFEADSNTSIVKGIVALLIGVLDNHTPDEILNADLHFIDDIGLGENLSPYRANGLVAMLKQMKYYALAFKTKQEEGK